MRRLGSAIHPTSALILLAGLVGAAQGCDCKSEPDLTESAPKIEVDPNPVNFGTVAMLEEAVVVLVISNGGIQELTLDDAPVLVENTEDGLVEIVMRAVLTPVDCNTGAERADDDPTTLLPGECSSITLAYRPQNLGGDTGSLTLGSNDPETPSLVVPIIAEGAAPDIEVCLMVGDCTATEICFTAGDAPLSIAFPLTQIAATTSCPVRITNNGALPLERLDWGFKSGNRRADYSLDPSPLSAVGALAPTEGIQAMIVFTPKSGGPKDALVEITSSDPDEAAVAIQITGMGDGPKVCPDPFPLIDFGQVEVGTTKSLDIELKDCGTMDLTITAMEVQNASGTGGSNEFALGAGAPSAPIPLAPQATVTVPLEFTPPRSGPFTARLYLETTDPVVPSGWLSIVGEGQTPPACELQASSRIVSFGATAPSTLGGTPIEKTIALSNPGALPCTGVDALITAGDTVRFEIVGVPVGGPPWTLASGDIVIFTLRYDPQDTTGPDTGLLAFSATELAGPLEVQLTGSPVAVPSCQLDVLPNTGNFTLGFCSIIGGFNPRVVQFGASPMGARKTLPITLENTGSANCTVSKTTISTFNPGNPFGGPSPALTIDAPPNQILVNGSPTQTIAPGEIGSIPITFLPLNEEEACGAIEIETNELTFAGECLDLVTGLTKPGCYKVSTLGSGVRPLLQVVPTDLKFGVITVGCASAQSEVTIYNTGGNPINLTDVRIDPTTSPFLLTSVPGMPYTIPAGDNVKVGVRYQPPDANPHSATLIIESNDPTSPLVSIPLTGEGTNDPHQTDLFNQLSEPMVDVLWVVDNSCSMGGEQDNVAANAGIFLAQALSLSTDFHLGVITTDMEDPADSGLLQEGGFYGPAPKWIDRTTPSPDVAFSNSVRQGTMGDASEKGLMAAHAALSFPIVDDPALNGGFIREDAKLTVIVISDEENSSPSIVDFYVDAFKNVKGYRRPDLMSFSAVVGEEPTGCSSSAGAAGAGTRYLEVARRTGGLERSICTTNWGQLANDLGLDAFGAKTEFYLSREAIDATLEVRVDNVLVPRTGNWTYDAATNSVSFEPLATPAQGATVQIDYDTICR